MCHEKINHLSPRSPLNVGWHRRPSITLCLHGQQPHQIPLPPVSHRLAPEFATFAELFHRQDYGTMNTLLDHSLAVMQTLDKLREISIPA